MMAHAVLPPGNRETPHDAATSSTMRRPTPPIRRGSGGSNCGCSVPESVTETTHRRVLVDRRPHDDVAESVAEGVGDQLADHEQGIVGLRLGDLVADERPQPLSRPPHRGHLAAEHEHVVSLAARRAGSGRARAAPQCHRSTGAATPSTSVKPAMRRTRVTASDAVTSRTRPG